MELSTDLVVQAAQSDLGQKVIDQATEFLSNVLKEPAQAVGGLLADTINKRRYRNLARAVSGAKQLLSELGLTEKDVPLKILHPALEAASAEESPDMQSRWSNLLANSADPREEIAVLAMFPSILKDLGTREVKFLDALYASACRQLEEHDIYHSISQMPLDQGRLMELYVGLGLSRSKNFTSEARQTPDVKKDQNDFWLMLDVIRRHDVIRDVLHRGIDRGQPSARDLVRSFQLTDLGVAFIEACRPPADAWDRRFEADVETGKLDALAERALRDHSVGRSTEL